MQPLSPIVPGLAQATLSTGANVVTGAGYAHHNAGYGRYGKLCGAARLPAPRVPLIALRGISDGADPLEGLHSWTEYLHIVDENLAAALDRAARGAGRGRTRL